MLILGSQHDDDLITLSSTFRIMCVTLVPLNDFKSQFDLDFYLHASNVQICFNQRIFINFKVLRLDYQLDVVECRERKISCFILIESGLWLSL